MRKRSGKKNRHDYKGQLPAESQEDMLEKGLGLAFPE